MSVQDTTASLPMCPQTRFFFYTDQTKNLSNKSTNKAGKQKYNRVLKSLLKGCKLLEKNKCKFIVIPCNTAHYWFNDLQKKINIPIINMPKEVYKFTKKKCKKNSKVGLLATEGTLRTGVYKKIFENDYQLIEPSQKMQGQRDLTSGFNKSRGL